MSLLLTRAAPGDTTHILRAPLFARLADPRPPARQEYVANLLPLQSMAPARVSPPTVDQPIGGARPPAKPFDPPNLLLTTLAPPPVVPYNFFRAPLFARLPDPRPMARQEYVVNLLPIQATPVVTYIIRQSDWPSALRGPAKAIGEAVGGSSPLLTPNPPQPFVQSDWLRQPSLPKAIGEPYGTINALLTPNPARPFNQYEWRSTARVPISLKSDVYFGAFPLYSPNPPIPFNQDLWENAALPRPKAGGEATALPLVDYQPFSQDLWESATKAWPKAIGEAVAGVAPLLTPNPAQPFVQSDWFQIRSTQKARVDEPFNLTIYLPTVTVTYIISQLDWPMPARMPPKQADTSVAASAPLYTPNPPQPFVQSAWDSAIRAFPKAGGEVTGTLSPVLTPNPARPFAQRLWESATPPKPKAYADPFAAISALYNPNPSKPFSQYQWDSATRAWPKAVGEATGGILALLAPNPANPFNQSDWTRILTTSKAKVDDFAYLQTLYSVVVVAAPFHQNDWFTVARALPPQKSDVYRGPNALLTPNPARPFHQDLWDLPTQLPRLKSIGDVLASPNPIIYPNPSRPFGQGDWPSSAKSGPSDRSFTLAVNLPLAVPPIPPPPTVGINPMIGAYPRWRKL